MKFYIDKLLQLKAKSAGAEFKEVKDVFLRLAHLHPKFRRNVGKNITENLVSSEKVRRDFLQNLSYLIDGLGKEEQNRFPMSIAVYPIHGDLDILEKIKDGINRRGPAYVVFLGGYFGKTRDNVKVFEQLREIKNNFDQSKKEAKFLIGKEELLFLKAILFKDNYAIDEWVKGFGFYMLKELGIKFSKKKYFEDENERETIRNKIKFNKTLMSIALWLKKNTNLYTTVDGTLAIGGGLPIDNAGNMRLEYAGLTGINALMKLDVDLKYADSAKSGAITTAERAIFFKGNVLFDSEWVPWREAIGKSGYDKFFDPLGVHTIISGFSNVSKLDESTWLASFQQDRPQSYRIIEAENNHMLKRGVFTKTVSKCIVLDSNYGFVVYEFGKEWFGLGEVVASEGKQIYSAEELRTLLQWKKRKLIRRKKTTIEGQTNIYGSTAEEKIVIKDDHGDMVDIVDDAFVTGQCNEKDGLIIFNFDFHPDDHGNLIGGQVNRTGNWVNIVRSKHNVTVFHMKSSDLLMLPDKEPWESQSGYLIARIRAALKGHNGPVWFSLCYDYFSLDLDEESKNDQAAAILGRDYEYHRSKN